MRPLIGVLCSTDDTGGSPTRDYVNRSYCDAVRAAGGTPVPVPCGSDEEATRTLLELVQGLIVTGGCDIDPACYDQWPRRQLGALSPDRDVLDRYAVEYALSRPDLPMLGICRGIQAMNVFAGGSLVQDVPSQVGDGVKHSQEAPGWYGTHTADIVPGTVLAATLGSDALRVNSFHHQAVDQTAPGFVVSARAADGVVEVIEREGSRYCIGVQFHPELMAGRDGRIARLFGRLVSEAARDR